MEMKQNKKKNEIPTGEKTQEITTKKKSKQLSVEDLAPYIDKPFIKTKTNKLGETVLYLDNRIVSYIAQRSYGLAFQTLNGNSWKTTRITKKEQLQKKFDAIEQLHNANESVKQAWNQIVG